MELVQELFMTAFVALIFSFCVAKLVSLTTSSHTKSGLGLKESSDNVLVERAAEETKFDHVLRVQRTKSKRKVRFADESVQKVDKFEASEERCRSAVISDAAGRLEVVEIKEVDNVSNLNGLVVKEEGSEGKKVEEIETESVMNEGNVTADVPPKEETVDKLERERASDELEQPCCSNEFEEKLFGSGVIFDAEGRVNVVDKVGAVLLDSLAEQLKLEEADMGGTGVDVIKEEGVVGNLDGLVVEEGREGKKAHDVESVSIKEEDGMMTNLDGFGDVIEEERKMANLDGLVVEEACKGKKVDDIERVSIKEEGVMTNLDGLFFEEDSEGNGVVDVESVKEDDAVTTLDGLGVKEGGERKVVDDVESAILEGNEKEELVDIEKRCEEIKGDDIGNEIKEEGVVTDLDGLVHEEGGKEVDDVEIVSKELGPMADLVFDGKIVENADADVGDVETVIEEGNEMTDLVFERKIVENADLGCKIGIGFDDIIVAQDATVSDVESGIQRGLNKGDIKEEKELAGDEEDDDWEGIERSELDEAFTVAAKYVASGGNDDRLSSMGSDVQMQLYGLHKVAMEGPCQEPQPMALKISSRAKWYETFLLGVHSELLNFSC